MIILYAFMADTHLGAAKLNPNDYLKSLDMFLSIIKNHKEECHCIFVCGDLFDYKLSIEDARHASIFLLNLVCNNCGRNGRTHVPVHFIHGTYTHDYEQYKVFMPILERIDNTEIFYTKEVCIGKLRNDVKILYLPQYGDDDYAKYFDKKYDIIVGHGPMSSDSKSPCKSSPREITHSATLLGDISKICVFGHYHGYTDFGKNVFYAGPWLRWQYGEDEPRRFFFCNDNFEVETFPNPIALEYKTIDIKNPEELRDIISTNITTPHRFIIHAPNEDLETYHAIMNTNKKNQNLKYQILSDTVNTNCDNEADVESISSSVANQIEEPIQTLISYISDKYDIDTSKEIHEYDDKINKE